MKNIVFLTLFFYLVSFANPQKSHAVVPLAIIGASMVGAALVSSSVGAYYIKNGTLPEYVKATANSVGSAADYLFQPTFLAAGPIALVTLASFPAAASVYLGKNSSVGISLGDMAQAVADAESSAYSNLRSLLTDNSSDATLPEIPLSELNAPSAGTYWVAYNSNVYTLPNSNPSWSYLGWNKTGKTLAGVSNFTGAAGSSDSSEIGTAYVAATGFNKIALVKLVYNTSGGGWKFYATSINLTTTHDPTYQPVPGGIIYPNLATALKPVPESVADDVRDIIKKAPPGQIVKSLDVPATIPDAVPSTLTQAELNQALKNNTAQVAQAAADAAAAAAAADPSDTAAQIAAQQAALEAARAAAEAADPAESEDYTASAPSLTLPEIKAISFRPIIDAKNLTLSKIPFSWLSSISTSLSSLVATPQSPVFIIDLGIIEQEINLSFLDSFAESCRSIISFFMYLATIFLLIKIYRSM